MSFISIDGWEPRSLSYSTVAGYRDCGKKIQLQRVFGFEEHPGLAAPAGNAVHSATEDLDLRREEARMMGTEFDPGDVDLDELFKIHWEGALQERLERSPSFKVEEYIATGRAAAKYGGKKNLDWWFDNGPIMIQKWLDWRAEVGWEIAWPDDQNPGIETELNFTLPGDIPVRGYIDRVFELPGGKLAVVDLKTGRIPETAEQLGLYKVGLELVHGLTAEWGYYWSPDKGHGEPRDLRRYTPEYFGRLFSDAARGINAGVFLPHPANSCKNWCGVSRFCAAVGGAQAQGHDPLFCDPS